MPTHIFKNKPFAHVLAQPTMETYYGMRHISNGYDGSILAECMQAFQPYMSEMSPSEHNGNVVNTIHTVRSTSMNVPL